MYKGQEWELFTNKQSPKQISKQGNREKKEINLTYLE
jgi:hypothetical protein